MIINSKIWWKSWSELVSNY